MVDIVLDNYSLPPELRAELDVIAQQDGVISDSDLEAATNGPLNPAQFRDPYIQQLIQPGNQFTTPGELGDLEAYCAQQAFENVFPGISTENFPEDVVLSIELNDVFLRTFVKRSIGMGVTDQEKIAHRAVPVFEQVLPIIERTLSILWANNWPVYPENTQLRDFVTASVLLAEDSGTWDNVTVDPVEHARKLYSLADFGNWTSPQFPGTQRSDFVSQFGPSEKCHDDLFLTQGVKSVFHLIPIGYTLHPPADVTRDVSFVMGILASTPGKKKVTKKNFDIAEFISRVMTENDFLALSANDKIGETLAQAGVDTATFPGVKRQTDFEYFVTSLNALPQSGWDLNGGQFVATYDKGNSLVAFVDAEGTVVSSHSLYEILSWFGIEDCGSDDALRTLSYMELHNKKLVLSPHRMPTAYSREFELSVDEFLRHFGL